MDAGMRRRRAGRPGPPIATASLLAALALAGPALALEGPTARGIVRPVAEATISAEMSGRIVELPFRPGESFAAGDLLVRFDCAAQQANAAAAEAELEVARLMLDSARELTRMKAAGLRDVDLAQARRDKAAADVEGAAVKLRACEIRAPFAGAVVERAVNLHEVIVPNTPLLKLVDRERVEVELIVPSTWLAWLKPGAPFDFMVDALGRAVPGEVTRLGASVDAVSQTANVYAAFRGPRPGVLAGMSGSAVFAPPE
jgi:membrane fusion protein (multidrug efflux system)